MPYTHIFFKFACLEPNLRMKLTRLEIKGFKSFGDRVSIQFDDGITAIVGPNGCGKSNVVDAIRWVLGEQSTRALRSEKMENILFNGTKTRKASHLAEVSLSFDNINNTLATEFSQVTITRKLYRSGESEYRINDVQCRLKDITDLFLDTGIGSDSYSIIELKMIDEIINNKDHSRRALFEEASGISKYKVRKKQTLSKLKDTDTDLSRIDDVLLEIGKNLKTLEGQAKKAERYFRLKERYRSESLTLASVRISGYRIELETLDAKLESQQKEQTVHNESVQRIEEKIQQKKQASLLVEKNLTTQRRATNEHLSKIRAYESEKKVKNEQLRNLGEQKERLDREIRQDRQQLEHIRYNKKRLEEERLSEQERCNQMNEALSEKRQLVDEWRTQQQSAKLELEEATRMNNELQNGIHLLEKELAVLQIQHDALLQERERNTLDAGTRATELNQFNLSLQELEDRLETLQSSYDEVWETEQENKRQKELKSSQLEELKARQNRQNRLMDARQNEYDLTKSLVDNLEGFPESIRFVRKNVQWKETYPLFSDILFCREAYRIAIENFLEPVMNHYVVHRSEEALQAIRLLSDAARGRASFFILNEMKSPKKTDSPAVSEAWIPALSVVEVNAEYQKLIEQLLSNVLIYNGPLEDFNNIGKDFPFHTLIHHSGGISKTPLALTGGSVGLFEGKRIGRAKNLENLQKELKALRKENLSMDETYLRVSGELEALRETDRSGYLREQQLQINRLQQEHISVKTRKEQHETFLKGSQNRKADIETKVKELLGRLHSGKPELEEKLLRRDQLSGKLESLALKHELLEQEVNTHASAYNQENIRFHQQQNKLSGIIKDLEYRDSQYENLDNRVRQAERELEDIRKKTESTLSLVDHSDEDLIQLYQQKDLLETAVTEMEEQHFRTRGEIQEQEEQVLQLRRSKEQGDLILSELKDKKTVLRIDLNALKERLAVEFQVDIQELLDDEAELPEQEYDALQKQNAELKKQLEDFGSINSVAMEAYKEMKDRHDFIIQEKKDLVSARQTLLNTINEIDQTAKDQFMAAFGQVRLHFIEVFRSLFIGEDSCDLLLSNPEAPLESDIEIIARPKGKRPLSINQLSGGEKTLTSTALLFSLYLLKPAPFCIFDEVDAPLDDTNIDKFNGIIRKFSGESQFIIVSHNKRTIASTDIIYGVTMIEQGISRVVAVDLRDV